MAELEKRNRTLTEEMETLGNEIEFNLKEKDEELRHWREKCASAEQREARQREHLKSEIETIR